MENNKGKLKKEDLNLVEENSIELNSVEESKKDKNSSFNGLFSWISKFIQKWNLLLYLTILSYF